MGDLQLTKEFKETTIAIGRDILQNPQEYKQAGEWLDHYYDKEFCQKKMKERSERLLADVFVYGINRGEYYCPVWYSSGSPTIKAYEVLQAVAMDEFNHFASMWDILQRDDLAIISPGSLSHQMAKDIVATRFGNKSYAALKDRLWLAYKEMLEIREECKLIGQEESMIVCLLTWLLTNPDANKAALDITEFERWEWYSLYKSGVCSQRADVIRLLHACEMLQDWQNLACETWQRIRSLDGKTEQCEQVGIDFTYASQKSQNDFDNENWALLWNLGIRKSLTEEEVTRIEKHLGSLPDSLLDLAKLIRNLDKNANSSMRDHETIERQLLKVHLATIRLRPKIELVVGTDQADDFENEMCTKLRFWKSGPDGNYYDDGNLTVGVWLGRNGKAEGIARRLEQWNRNILLLTKAEIASTENGLKSPEKEQIGETEQGKTDEKTLTKAMRLAYQSYKYAISQDPKLAEAKDDDVYDWLKESGTDEDDYELPSRDTWKRQVRGGRKYHGTQKNTPRVGRTSRSIFKINQIKYSSSQKTD